MNSNRKRLITTADAKCLLEATEANSLSKLIENASDFRDLRDQTLLHYFVCNPYCDDAWGKKVVTDLLNKFPGQLTAIDEFKRTPLQKAAGNGASKEVLELLIEKEEKLSPQTVYNNVVSSFKFAASIGRIGQADCLLKFLKRKKAATDLDIETAIFLAISEAAKNNENKENCQEVVSNLLQELSHQKKISDVLKTALRSAIKNNLPQMVWSFLPRLTDKDIQVQLRQFILYEAARCQNLTIVINTLIQSIPLDKRTPYYSLLRKLPEKFSSEYEQQYFLNLIITAENRLDSESLLTIIFQELEKKHSHAFLSNITASLKKKKTSDEKTIPLDSILKKFKAQKFPLEEKEINLLGKHYKTVLTYESKLQLLSSEKLKKLQDDCILDIQSHGLKHGSTLKLIAIIREQIIRLYGTKPYSTQMINLLAMINHPEGCFAQIKTGEGKSLLIAMLAAFKALVYKEKVSIITTTPDLAESGAQQFFPLFSALGLTSDLVDRTKRDQTLHSDIAYGTISDFVFPHLEYQLGNAAANRQLDSAILDEADSQIYDDTTSIHLSCENPYYFKEIIEEIWKDQGDDLPARIQKMGFSHFPLDLLQRWKNAAKQAMELKEGKDYKIIDNKIHIVNFKHNGVVAEENVHWGNMLHCFLALKHKLKLEPDTATRAFLMPNDFFRQFKNLFGLSATLGNTEERKKILSFGPIKHYDSPPHFESQRHDLPHIITKDENDQKAKLIATLKEMKEAGRPVLIICQTIHETEQLENILREEKIQEGVHVYNAVQEKSVTAILKEAGQCSAATLATNIAGRGTDIKIPPEVIAKGGLHVIVTSLAINERVEEQNFGRAARQGLPGSCQYIVTEQEFKDRGIAPNFEALKKYREKQSKKWLEESLLEEKYYALVYSAQEVFFSLPAPLKNEFEDLWKEQVVKLEKIINKYRQSSKDQHKAAEKEICQSMLDFWENSGLSSITDESLHQATHDLKFHSVLTSHFSELEYKSEPIKKLKQPRLVILDMDKTLLKIHTGGILLGPPDQTNFKNPTALKTFFSNLYKQKISAAIATFATEIELQSSDGTVHPPLFLSGKAALEAQFKALLGEHWQDMIKNIQAYEVNDRIVTKKITYQVSLNQYEKLKLAAAESFRTIDELQKELIENELFGDSKEIETAIMIEIQKVYDDFHSILDSFTIKKKEETSSTLPYGKIPHTENICREMKCDDFPREEIVFCDDDHTNRTCAKLTGCTVVENISSCDELRWLQQFPSSPTVNLWASLFDNQNTQQNQSVNFSAIPPASIR